MKKYDKEIAQAQLDNEKAVLKKLEANYKDALEEINSKIAELMGRADADMQHVVYQVEYQKALKAQTEAILKTLQNKEFETVSAYLTECYDEGFKSTLYAIQKQGVPLIFPINQEEVASAIQLETNLSTSLYEAFDMKDLQKKIAGEISRGFSTGALYSEITRNVASYAQISKNKAMRIVRTEGHRITETAAANAQKRAKDRGADIVKIWDATLDSNTRPSHMRVDGEIKEIGKKFSNGLEFPGDPSGSAAEVINCRCRSRSDARWALEADETKMLGDVSKMSEERKEEIAKKLGVPVDTLDQYSNQIVPVKAKDYADFKRQYDKLWHYEGSALQKEAEERIASYGKKTVANSASPGKMEKIAVSSSDASSGGVAKLTRQEKKKIINRGINEKRPIFAVDTEANKFASNVVNVKAEEGFFDVALHGRDTSVKFFDQDIDAYTLSQIIRQRDDYKKGMPVRLLSCSTGKTENTGDCVAQIVANELGVIVKAPTEDIWVYPNGTYIVGKRNEGKMVIFYPRK